MIIAFNWISIQIDQTVVIDQPLRPASGPFPHMAVARGEHDKSKGEFQKKLISQKEQRNRLVYQSNKEGVRKCSVDTTGSSEPNK